MIIKKKNEGISSAFKIKVPRSNFHSQLCDQLS